MDLQHFSFGTFCSRLKNLMFSVSAKSDPSVKIRILAEERPGSYSYSERAVPLPYIPCIQGAEQAFGPIQSHVGMTARVGHT